MLRSKFLLACLGSAAFALAACGNAQDGSGGSGGTGATGGAGGAGNTPEGPGIQPPGKNPDAGPPTGVDNPVLAIRKLYLGDTDRKGVTSSTAWEEFGYDLDGKISTKDSKDLCQPAEGVSASVVYEDGEDGRDNSFGKNILTIITGLASDASTQINNSIEGGSFTIMLSLDELGADAEANGIHSKLYGGSKLVDMAGMEIAPAWDGTDEWPVIYELLEGGDITKPKVEFPDSYVVKDPASGARTWVSGDFGDVTLNLSISDFTLSLNIRHAVISMELADDNATATNGTIAGILDTEQLITELGKVSGQFDICPGDSTFESIAQQIRQASDIGKDGAQDPKAVCDGISIGLGFEMQKVLLGPVAEPSMGGTDPCAMP